MVNIEWRMVKMILAKWRAIVRHHIFLWVTTLPEEGVN